MQAWMNRLAVTVRTRRKLVIGIWIVALLVAIPFASRQTENLSGAGFEVPGSGSANVEAQIARFQGVTSDPLGVVLEPRGGDAAAMRAAIDRVERAAAEVDHVELGAAAAEAAGTQAGEGGPIILPLEVEGHRDAILDAAKDLRDELDAGSVTDGVQPYIVGQQGLWAGMQELQKEDLEKAEISGFPFILIVLLAVFGSLAAALLPIGLGVSAVIITGAAIYLLALATTMSVFVTNVASMLGIGLAVDYSLFLLSRYREELDRGGGDRSAALDVAMRTSGATIIFSGITVMVSLAGLFLLDATVMRSLAIGAIVVVAIAIIGAVTLLPALIAVLGRRASERGRIVSVTGTVLGRLRPRPRRPEPREGFWVRWTGRLMNRPWLYASLAAASLLVLAIPALSLDFGSGALRQFPKDNETRRGAEIAATLVTPGASAPLIVTADFGDARADRAAVDRYAAAIGRLPDVAEVEPARISTDGRAALLRVVPARDPESDETIALISRIRDGAGLGTGIESRAALDVGGPTAQDRDFVGLVSGGIWKVFLFVLLCSYVVLLVVLRSVLLPLKAIIMNLLSVGACYGVLVAVFQYGWLDGLLGYDSLGYVNAITPPLLLAIVFGLSMDYEVFLLSRIRERYLATGDNRAAVAEGLSSSARVITSAAVIMVVVFATFALTGVPQIKEIGVGLAVAIALDATLVRLVLVPATMQLMGDANWWLPGWLEHILPHVDFESDALGARTDEPEAEAEAEVVA